MAAPAGATLFASLADETIAAQLAADYDLLLADRNALQAHPALGYRGSIVGAGSNALKVPQIGLLGYDRMGTGTEGDPVANTDITDSAATITVVQKTIVREPSDLAKMVDKYGALRPDMMGMDALMMGTLIFRYMVANVTDDFTATVGTSGAAATFSDLLDSITTLEIAQAVGPFLGILHPKQWGDIRKDVAVNSGGAIQWNSGSQRVIDMMKGLGSQGNWLGVDWVTTTDVPTATGSNYAGGVFGTSGVIWMDGEVQVEDSINQHALANKILFERQRVVAGGTTKYATHRYLGVSIGINAAGVSIITGQ